MTQVAMVKSVRLLMIPVGRLTYWLEPLKLTTFPFCPVTRWGSCSRKGLITLSTELIKLPDIYIEYVIIHELCHLKHHNHGKEYYNLLSELFPDWKKVRKDLREYIH